MSGKLAKADETELMRRFKIGLDDPLAPSLLLIDQVTRTLEGTAHQAVSAAGKAAEATHEQLMAEVLERITQSLIQKTRLQAFLVAVALAVVPVWLDHLWLKYEYDQNIDANVAARLDATSEDVGFALRVLKADPNAKANLSLMLSLEESRPGFMQWAVTNGLPAYDLFTYNGNATCPTKVRYRSGEPGCAFKDPNVSSFVP